MLQSNSMECGFRLNFLETSEATRTTTAHRHWWHSSTSRTTCSVRRTHLFACLFTAEEVYFVYGVYHYVVVHRVVFRVASHHGVDGARDVALLLQQVVELQRHRESLAAEEALRQLHVPDKLVGVHRRVVETAAAVHREVGGYCSAPRCLYVGAEAVREHPCVEVRLWLQLVAGVGVVE